METGARRAPLRGRREGADHRVLGHMPRPEQEDEGLLAVLVRGPGRARRRRVRLMGSRHR